MRTRIGDRDALGDLPVPVDVHGDPYILSRDDDGRPVLFSALCPHQGGRVAPGDDGALTCPLHGWRFSATSGCSTNIQGRALQPYPVEVDADGLWADLPHREGPTPPRTERADAVGPRIELVAHASLLIESGATRLLTDPWIEGPAFFGAWVHDPAPVSGVAALPPVDAIFISHEHSDHFHVPTLERFPRDVRVFVPDIEDGRLARRVRDLGFAEVTPMAPGVVHEVGPEFDMAVYPSAGVWPDSILWSRHAGFEVLNCSDAGINHRVRDKHPRVDLVASAFSAGASGYPLTWDHLDLSAKRRIVAATNEGMLRMLEQLVSMFQPRYLLPFAAHTDLAVPSHAHYRSERRKNSLADVVQRFSGTPVKVLDLLPGDAWNGDGHITRAAREQVHVGPAHVDGPAVDLDDLTLARYFGAFSGSALAARVGMLTFDLRLTGARPRRFFVSFDAGSVVCLPAVPDASAPTPWVRMEAPEALVAAVVRQDLSWDEVHIGHWARQSRDPDVFNAPFWELLAAPWRARARAPSVAAPAATAALPIATIVERGGAAVREAFAAEGLHCAGCAVAPAETLERAVRAHGLGPAAEARLYRAVASAFPAAGDPFDPSLSRDRFVP